jgi:hypothetical protein
MTQLRSLRHGVAGAAGVAAGLYLFSLFDANGPVFIPAIGLTIAAVAVHFPQFGAQLLARAMWWSHLGLGTVLCVISGGRGEMKAGLALAAASAFALFVVGRKGLAEASERAEYLPSAFRSSLMLLMVLALADAQTMFLFGAVALNRGSQPIVPLAACAAFITGYVGLHRLKFWGAIVNATTALAVVALVWLRVAHVEHDVDRVMVVVCAVQLLVAAPMLVAVALRQPLPSLGPRARAWGAATAIVALLGICCLSAAGILGR